MHLHLWNAGIRNQALGTTFIKQTLPYFFKNFGIKLLYSEPYALNAAPNKTLEKAGFEVVLKLIYSHLKYKFTIYLAHMFKFPAFKYKELTTCSIFLIVSIVAS